MRYLFYISFLLLAFNTIVRADVMTDVYALQKAWAETNYNLKGKEQKTAFDNLVKQADQVVQHYPDSAEAFIWRGIIESSFAGAKGGLGALSLAKAAKADFEQALALNDTALEGSAYTSLGTLYFKVPGWPLGFGDHDKAETLLKKALTINPNGIDSNYFYGQYLYEERNYEMAEQYLSKAQHAPARAGRPLADKGRQLEIEEALKQVKYQLNNNKHAGFTH
jgi:tetratricopeptide (TPR) repeat protein